MSEVVEVAEDLGVVVEGAEMREAVEGAETREAVVMGGDVEGAVDQEGIITEVAMKTGDDRTDITTEK